MKQFDTSNFCFSVSLQNETRYYVDLNNFGFFPNATLDVNISLRLPEKQVNYSTYPVSGCYTYLRTSLTVCSYLITSVKSEAAKVTISVRSVILDKISSWFYVHRLLNLLLVDVTYFCLISLSNSF